MIWQQKLKLKNIVSRFAMDLTYIKRSYYTKNVITEINWTFELGVQSGIDIFLYLIV